jgi:hypothetical protein
MSRFLKIDFSDGLFETDSITNEDRQQVFDGDIAIIRFEQEKLQQLNTEPPDEEEEQGEWTDSWSNL